MTDLTTAVANTLTAGGVDPADATPVARLVLATVAQHGRLLPAIGEFDPAIGPVTAPAVVYDQLKAGVS